MFEVLMLKIYARKEHIVSRWSSLYKKPRMELKTYDVNISTRCSILIFASPVREPLMKAAITIFQLLTTAKPEWAPSQRKLDAEVA